MSFQAYLDSVEAQTGKTAEDFRLLAGEKGLVKNGEIVAWLKSDYGLGHGHANAIAHVITQHGQERVSTEDAMAAHFTGKKAVWREPYDALMAASPSSAQMCRQGPPSRISACCAVRRNLASCRCRSSAWISASSSRALHPPSGSKPPDRGTLWSRTVCASPIHNKSILTCLRG